MIGFLGRMTLAIIVTAMLVFGGLLVGYSNSGNASTRYFHHYVPEQGNNGTMVHTYPHHPQVN